ncbi:MAG: nuclear transport factor 2 family protein [Rhodospirillales bacterium]|nr:nuclear transport factor 2 family protein [Rhodospirillales bacterium]
MTQARGLEAAVAAYVAFYEGLTPERLERLEALCAPDVRFRDPFNDVTGVAAYRSILARMFEDVAAPRFAVIDRAISGRVAYLRWNFSFVPRGGVAPWRIEGMSEVHFDEEGRVSAHLDHWDSGSQFYGRLPLLRHVIALIRKRLSVDSK